MSKTEVSGKQLKDGSVELVDLAPEVSGALSTLQSNVATLQTDVAAKADAGNLASVATSGSYNDLSDKPSIPSVAGLASETYVDTAVAGKADSTSLATVATSGSYTDLTNKPSLFSGDYDDLANKPTIPSVAGLASETYVNTAVAGVVNSAPAVLDTLNELSAALGNDENFATTVAGQIGDVASDVSALDNRVDVLETDVASLQNSLSSGTNIEDLNGVSITSPASGQVLKYDGLGWVNAADSTFSGAYADLAGKPTLFDGAYSSLTGAPSLATVATSGSYSDLSNKPTIPAIQTTESSFLYDSFYDGKALQVDIKSGGLTTSTTLPRVVLTGSYNDLTDKPTLFDGAYSSLTGAPSLATVATSGSYSDLSNKPTLSSFTTLTSPASGQYLKYNGTNWVNSAIAAADLPVANQSAGIVDTGFQIFNGEKRFASTMQVNAIASFGTAISISGGQSGTFAGGKIVCGGAATTGYMDFFTKVNGQQFQELKRANISDAGLFSMYYGASIESGAAATKGLIVKGAASQTANLFEAQTSAGTALCYVNVDTGLSASGTTSTFYVAGGTNNRPTAIFRKSAAPNFGFIEFQDSAGTTGAGINKDFAFFTGGATLSGNSGFQLFIASSGISADSWGRSITVGAGANTNVSDAALYVRTASSYASHRGFVVQQTSAGPDVNIFELRNSANTTMVSTSGNGATFIGVTSASAKPLIVRGAASQTANLFEAQNSAGTALTVINSDGTVHAKRYTETSANAFNTSLAPSSGTLTVDTSVGNAVLGALSASVTTWAFTNVPTDNSKVTSVTAVLLGNTSFTYGDACSVNGSAVTNGIMWSGGSAPTPTTNTDIITFIIVRDSAGTIKVFGSATTNFS